MLTRRLLLALAGAGLRAQQQQSGNRAVIPLQAAQFEGSYLGSAAAADIQTLSYLVGYKVFPRSEPPAATVAFQMARLESVSLNNANLTWRLLGRYHAIRMNRPEDDALHAALSLQCLPERRIQRPGSRLPVQISPIFTLNRPLKAPLRAHLQLEDGQGKEIGKPETVPIEELNHREVSLAIPDLAPGDYQIRFRLTSEAGVVQSEAVRPIVVSATMRETLARLQAKAAQAALQGPLLSGELSRIRAGTAQETISLYQQAFTQYVSSYPERMHPFASMACADAVPKVWTNEITAMGELESIDRLCDDPRASLIGLATPRRLALRLVESERADFFRLVLPENFTEGKRYPMVVAVHPEFGDQGTMAEMFLGPDGKSHPMVDLARQRGYILLMPGNRGHMEWFETQAPLTIPAMVRQLTAALPVNARQVYLWGHSLGGTVCLKLLYQHDLWAGAAVVAARSARDMNFQSVGNIPLAFFIGTADKLVNAQQGLVILNRLKPVVKQQDLHRLEGQDHWSIGAASIQPAFDFFDKLRNQVDKPAAGGE